MSILVNIPKALTDWLIPNTCLLCEEPSDSNMCPGCYRDLPWITQACDLCGLPLEATSICGSCLEQPPSFDRCISPFRFKPPVGLLINQLKHHRNVRNGNLLSNELVLHLRRRYRDQTFPDWIMPVPLHWRRLLTRGFNQALFIGQQAGKELNIPVRNGLRRLLPTPKQQGLNRKQRLLNLRDAFALKPQFVVPKHVAIIDDVMTTGATADAISRVLKTAGAERVDIWVLARTPIHGVSS